MSSTESLRRRRHSLLTAAAITAVIGAGALLWHPMVAWFTFQPFTHGAAPARAVGEGGAPAAPPRAVGGDARPGEPGEPVRFQGPALEHLLAALQSYESIRALLARDLTGDLRTHAEALAASLRAASESAGEQPADVVRGLERAQAAARLLGASDLGDAREGFAAMSEYLLALAGADDRLRAGWHVFECPMREGFNRWFQRPERAENPYMGRQMLRCGTRAGWALAAADRHPSSVAEPGPHGGEVSHFTCSMHPSVRQAGPGTCPICSMALVPVTAEEVASGVIRVDEVRRQRIGVKTSPVVAAPMDLSLRALGRVAYDETALVDVTLKVDGFINGLKAGATGEPVRKGDVLFRLYAPELYATQEEYLLARRTGSELLAQAARKRLALWGLPAWQIDGIAARGDPIRDLPILAPASGYVVEKHVVEGAAVKAGERLFRIAPLDQVWIHADVYERDLPFVKVGQPVEVTLPHLPGRTYRGRVAYVYPGLDSATRTGRIRIALPNQARELKPDMYADVRLEVTRGVRVQVPREAVIYTGPRRLVFVDLGDGRLAPRVVKLGAETDEAYEVLAGLREGERVVTGGNFLVAAESRIRSAAGYWTGGGDGAR